MGGEAEVEECVRRAREKLEEALEELFALANLIARKSRARWSVCAWLHALKVVGILDDARWYLDSAAKRLEELERGAEPRRGAEEEGWWA